MPLDNTDALSRYHFQLVSADGQPIFMQTLWVPENRDGSANWGGIFRGPPPPMHMKPDVFTMVINPTDPNSARINIWRD